MPNVSDSSTYVSIDQQLTHLNQLAEQIKNYLQQSRPAALPQMVYDGIFQLSGSMTQIQRQVNALEEERRSLKALAQIGQVVNSSLELDTVLQIVMDTIVRLTRAERGFLMMRNESGHFDMLVARNWVQETIDTSESTISRTIIDRVATEGQPVLTTNAQEDPRFGRQESVVA